MNISKEVLESIVTTVEKISHPDQVGYMLFEWLNDAGYQLHEIKAIADHMSGKVEMYCLLSNGEKLE